jgi:hypothetical protein
MNADDRLSLDPLGPVEGRNRIVEGSHVADVCPQPTNADPLDDLTQLGAIGYDDKVDSQAASGPRLGRAGDGHQRSSGANQARRPLPDVAADDIENQIDFADVFQGVVIEVDELLCAEVESRLTAASAPGADDVRPGLTCELGRHRTDCAGRTVHDDALPRLKAAVLEQPLPRGQAGITRAAPTVKSTSPGSGVRLRASTATYSASVPSRYQSVRPNTRCPIDSPVVP